MLIESIILNTLFSIIKYEFPKHDVYKYRKCLTFLRNLIVCLNKYLSSTNLAETIN